MQVNLHSTSGNQFTSYSAHSVSINQVEYHSNLVVGPDRIRESGWQSIQDLNLNNLNELLEDTPDLIIFGTGNTISFPSSEVLKRLQYLQIGFEVMAIPALCRTFNYLSGEGRKVVGVILF